MGRPPTAPDSSPARCRTGLHQRPSWKAAQELPCPQCENAALAQLAADIVTAVEPTLRVDQITAALEAAVPSWSQRRQVVDQLAADPGVLTDGRSATPLPLARFLTRLVAAGATAIAVPRCAACSLARPLPNRRGDERICTGCYRRATATACSGCGLVRPVQARSPQGHPLCANCRRTDPTRRYRCDACGQQGQIASRQGGVARCSRCYQRPSHPCDGCGTNAVIISTADGKRVCRRCYQHPKRRCDGCGQVGVIARQRVPEDPALCRACAATTAICHRCGRERPCRFAGHDQSICDACARRRERCARCGKVHLVAARRPDGPRCWTCYQTELRRKDACAGCGQLRRLFDTASGNRRCADCAGIEQTSHVCGVCGAEERLVERGRCERCVVATRVDVLLRDPNGAPASALQPVGAALLAANPHTALGWLRRSGSARLLTDLARGACPLTHQGLDAWGPPRQTEFLRHLLVACGVLPWRDPFVARFGHWLEATLADLDNAEHRRLLRQFATWRLLRHLRQLAARQATTLGALNAAKQALRQAAAFLAFLAEQHLRLAECRQDHLDAWLARGPTTRDALAAFLSWARQQRLTTQLRFPQRAARNPFQTATDEERWQLVDQLLTDPAITAADSVAGCLVLLFAQPVSRVARLTHADLDLDRQPATIRLGGSELELPPRLTTHLQELVADRQGRRGIDAPGDARWLFPGGAPGRPVSPTHLAKRLRALGIHVHRARNRAMLDLAGQLPPSVLADLLGFHPVTAAGWAYRAAGDRAAYVAARLQQRGNTPGDGAHADPG